MKIIKYILVASIAALLGCDEVDEAKVSLQTELKVTEPSDGRLEISIPVEVLKNDIGTFNLGVEIVEPEGEPVASESDYSLTEPVVIVTSSEQHSIKVVIDSDDLYEPAEYFALKITTDDEYVDIQNELVLVTIENVTPEPVATFRVQDATIVEGTGNQEVFVDLSNASEYLDMEIPFSLGGIATRSGENQGDYTITGNSFVIPAGETVGKVDLEIEADPIKEGGETIIFTLENPTVFTLGEIREMRVIIPGEIGLNDTGVVQHFTGTGFDTTPNNDYPDQDASVGLDATETDTFDGKAAFSFTKLDEAGNPLPSTSLSSVCVLDERTGLVWESKDPAQVLPSLPGNFNVELAKVVEASKKETDDPEYVPYPYNDQHRNWQSRNYTYWWHDPDTETNGGSSGPNSEHMTVSGYPISRVCAYPNENMTSYNPGNRSCNTQTYIEYANSLGVCGFKDWRLPDVEELRSLISYNPGDTSYDQSYFNDSINERYFSGTPHADALASAWCVDMSDGRAKLCNKQLPYFIRLVRTSND